MDVHRAARIAAAAHGGQIVLRDDAETSRERRFDPRPRRAPPQGSRPRGAPVPAGRRRLPAPPDARRHQPAPGLEPARCRERRSRSLSPCFPTARACSRSPGRAAPARHASRCRSRPSSSAHSATASSAPLVGLSTPSSSTPRLRDDRRARRPRRVPPRKAAPLLLDNFEHLLDAAPGGEPLLGAGTGVRALSPAGRLRVAGEQEYRAGAASGDGSRRALRRAGTRGQARGRARLHGRGDLPAPRRAPARRRARCGEDEAPRSPRLLERLDSALPLLTGGARDAHERQRTSARRSSGATTCLDSSAQELFARLSVFAGSFSLDAAEDICDADLDGLPPRRLQPSEDGRRRPIPDAGDDPRVRPRAASGRRAGSSGGGTPSISPPSPRRRRSPLRRGGRVVGTTRRRPRRPRAALDWLEMHDVDAAVELSGALGWFWLSRGLLEEGAGRLSDALSASGAGSRSRARALTGVGAHGPAWGRRQRSAAARGGGRAMARAGRKGRARLGPRFARLASHLRRRRRDLGAGGVRRGPRDPPRARRCSRRDSCARRRLPVLVALGEVERAETISRELLEGAEAATSHGALRLPLPRRLRVDPWRHGGGRDALPREPARSASTRGRIETSFEVQGVAMAVAAAAPPSGLRLAASVEAMQESLGI